MKNRKKIIIGIIALGLIAVLASFIYSSKHEPGMPLGSSILPNDTQYSHPVSENDGLPTLLSAWGVGDGIIIYATPAKISQSGDFRFYHTDQNGQRLEGDNWFWALPTNLKDKANIDRIYTMLSQHPQDVYEITGTKEKDDCNYYEAGPLVGTCVPSISFERIARMVTATSTTDVRGYTIEFSRHFAEDEPAISYWSKVRILKDGQVLFNTEAAQDFIGPNTNGIGYWIRSADDLVKADIKDITGDGIPELVLDGYSGGAHCCSRNYIIELSNPLSVLLDLDTGDNGITFIDNDAGGPMSFKTQDSYFGYWLTSYSCSPQPTIIYKLDEVSHKYVIDPDSMRKQAPSNDVIKEQANGWRSSDWTEDGSGREIGNLCVTPWTYALDLIYSGNAKSARDYIDLAWKPNSQFKSEDDFLNLFASQIRSSQFYKLAPASFWGLEYLQ
jgi:hypothetical protein